MADVDNRREKRELDLVMRQPVSKVKRKLAYPEETEGSRIAAVARKGASKLTTEQRRNLFKRAMVRIYGGQSKGATVAGH